MGQVSTPHGSSGDRKRPVSWVPDLGQVDQSQVAVAGPGCTPGNAVRNRRRPRIRRLLPDDGCLPADRGPAGFVIKTSRAWCRPATKAVLS